MKFLYYGEVYLLTGRWTIGSPGPYFYLWVEVYQPHFFGLVRRTRWANADYLYEINECGNSNG